MQGNCSSARGMGWRAVCAGLAVLLWAGGGVGFAGEYTGMPPFLTGVTTHFGQGKGLLDANLSLLVQAGIAATRDEAYWGGVEHEKGKLVMPGSYLTYLDHAVARGVAPLTILDYANQFYDGGDYPRSAEAIEGFVRYCEFVVTACKGKVRLYQVWNEWDGGCGMPKQFHGKGDPESYVKLLRVVHPRVKAADPAAIVVSNSVCVGDAYLESLLKLGMLECCDVVSLHTYNYNGIDRTPEDWLRRMKGVDEMLRRYSGGAEVPLFVTEMGWPTHVPRGGTVPEESGSFLARLYLLARTLPYIKGIWWYDFQDDGWDAKENENNFGLVRADLTPKPSYFAMAGVSELVRTAVFVERLDVGDPSIWVLRYRYPDARQALAVWSSYPDDDWQVAFRNAAATPAPVKVSRVGDRVLDRGWGTRRWYEKGAPTAPDTLELTVRDRPWIIEGDLAAVSVAGVMRREFPEAMRPKNVVLHVPGGAGSATAVGAPVREYAMGDERNCRRLVETGRTGPSDLDASFHVSYDRDCLMVTMTVTDDVFSQAFAGEDTWKGDGLQIAFQAFAGDDMPPSTAYTELDVALTATGPAVYRRHAQSGAEPGPLPAVQLQVNRDGARAVYELVLPVSAVDLPPLVRGTVIGFSLLVNDNDGAEREAYLRWGDGIGGGKNPLLYSMLGME